MDPSRSLGWKSFVEKGWNQRYFLFAINERFGGYNKNLIDIARGCP